MAGEPEVGLCSIDVSRLVERNVASLYSHLVTRPTGRAVRLAIEARLEEIPGPSVSLIDLSEVTVLDFSCADEVVAKLLLRYSASGGSPPAFFVFRGVESLHRGPVEAVLERHSLVTVAEVEEWRFELLGAPSERERQVWDRIEGRGGVGPSELRSLLSDSEDRRAVERLAERGLVFEHRQSRTYHSLGSLLRRGDRRPSPG